MAVSAGAGIPVTGVFAAEVRAGLAAHACPTNAAGMQRYMKTDMPFYGVNAPVVAEVLREVLRRHPIRDRETLESVVRELVEGAERREEWYVAAGLLKRPACLKLLAAESLDLIACFAATGAWWDIVDSLTKPVAHLLVTHRDQSEPLIRSWIKGVHQGVEPAIRAGRSAVPEEPSLWLRRLAIICQLGLGEQTDLVLLTDGVEAVQDESDFFLRKAIGWALREYSKTDGAWVRAFVDTHPRLSPLSRREALRWLERRAPPR